MGQEDEITKNNIELAVMATDIRYIKRQVQTLHEQLKTDFVRREEFEPIRKLVYGLVGAAGLAVITSIINLIIQSY